MAPPPPPPPPQSVRARYGSRRRSKYGDVRKVGTLSTVEKYAKAYKRTVRQAREELLPETAYSLFRSARHKVPRRPLVGLVAGELLCVDLAYVDVHPFLPQHNNGVKYLIIIVDTLSRYLWVRPLKVKSGRATAEQLRLALQSMRYAPKHVLSDAGTEFRAKECQAVFRAFNVKHLISKSDLKASKAERFIRTIKLRIARYLLANATNRYIDKLQAIVAQINGSKNRVIQMAPVEVNRENESLAFLRSVRPALQKIPQPAFKRGDIVRVQLERLGSFNKESRGTFSYAVYVVDAVDTRIYPTVYKLIEYYSREPVAGSFVEQQLTRIAEPQVRPCQVLRTRTYRGQRQYRVHWLGYPDGDDEWIDAKLIDDDAGDNGRRRRHRRS